MTFLSFASDCYVKSFLIAGELGGDHIRVSMLTHDVIES
jgi:hypothetical protein